MNLKAYRVNDDATNPPPQHWLCPTCTKQELHYRNEQRKLQLQAGETRHEQLTRAYSARREVA